MLNALFPFIYITTLIVLLVQAFRMMRLGDMDQSNRSTDMPRRVDRTGLLTTHPELLDQDGGITDEELLVVRFQDFDQPEATSA